MEQEKDVRSELRELTDSASLLLDEQTYTKDSCDRLIEAIGLAKVALQDWKADEETLQQAYDALCEAVDGLQGRKEEKRIGKKQKAKKADSKPDDATREKTFSLRKAAPYVICGAAIVGSAVYLVSNLRRPVKTRKVSFWDRIRGR